MSDGNGLPNVADTRARLHGLSILDRTLAEQRHERKAPAPEATPSRSMRVEAGMRAIEEAEREREDLRNALASCEADLRGARAELDITNLAHARALSEMDRHQHERDEAVSRLAAIEAIYDAVLTIMQKHRAGIREDTDPTPKDKP
jgi:predicted  nucleic acid-binding Zn-ribbon protein